MTEKLMVDRGCFERGCMGLPNPHERLIKEDEVVWLVEGKEWVSLTEEELKPICDEWRIIYGAWVDEFAKEIEAKLKERNT